MTEIGFKSGNVILLEDNVVIVVDNLTQVLKADRHSKTLWYASGSIMLNVTEVEYVRGVKVGQSPE